MKLLTIIERATDFGSFRSRKNIFSFSLKVLFYILPAVVLGNYTDTTIKKLKLYNALGDNTFVYISLQTMVIIVTLYIFIVLFKDYMSEFQYSIAGGYFIVLYFGMQTNYISMLKYLMS